MGQNLPLLGKTVRQTMQINNLLRTDDN